MHRALITNAFLLADADNSNRPTFRSYTLQTGLCVLVSCARTEMEWLVRTLRSHKDLFANVKGAPYAAQAASTSGECVCVLQLHLLRVVRHVRLLRLVLGLV